ncbi:MAG: hypothetical protein FJ098_10900 [Deltaproteobacteria bacterium]|nr:hypothetical protein [Deltaproteobacteria bacterium]
MKAVAALTAAALLAAASPRLARGEEFLSRDKYWHGLAGMTLASTGFGVTLALQEGDSTGIPWAVGAASALVPGLLKEGIDAATPGNRFSWMDLCWDGIGAAVGLTVAQLLWLAFRE